MGADPVKSKSWSCKECTNKVMMLDGEGKISEYCSIYIEKKRPPKRKWIGNEVICTE